MKNRPFSHRPEDYFLTFHTYGTWLPGDARGWHRHGDGAAPRPPAPRLEAWCRRQMRADAVVFTRAQRALVAAALRETCARRRYVLHALTVRTTHVHVVVTAAAPADTLLSHLKAWATRALRDGGHLADRPVWAKGGSTRSLYAPDGREGTTRYVHRHHHRSWRERAASSA